MAKEDKLEALFEKLEGMERQLEEMRRQEEVLVYDTKGLAKAMGINVHYAGKLMATRGFPSVKVGGAWKVPKKSLEDWLRHQEGHEVELER